MNVFACCSISAPNPIEKPLRTVDFGQARRDGLDRLAERNLRLGADHHHALLVLAIDLARSELRLNHHDVPHRQRHAAGGVDHHVVDVRYQLAIFLLQADDDRIFVAALAELRRVGACDVRADGVGDLRRVQAEQRGFGAIDLHGQLRARFVACEPRIGDARGRLEQVLHFQCEPTAGFEIFTADFDAHAALVALTARHQPVELVVAAARVGADDDSRNT